MHGKRYPEEFKIQAVKQVVDKGFTMKDVAQRLGVTYKSLYRWVQKYGKPNDTREA
jgi:transposase